MNEQCDIWCVESETLIIVPEFQNEPLRLT